MPSWLKLALCLFALTLLPALWAWGNTASWRKAMMAWRHFALYMLCLGAVGGLIGAVVSITHL